VKELLKLYSICQTYAQIKKFFWLAVYSVLLRLIVTGPLLVISSDVKQSNVCMSAWCQYFQNPKAPDHWADVDQTWHIYSYGSVDTTSRKWNFEYRPPRHVGVSCAVHQLHTRQQTTPTQSSWKRWPPCALCLCYWYCIFFIARLTCDTDIANMSVCLSVRDIPVSDENGLTYCHSFITQSFWFYQHQTSSRNSNGVHPTWALNTGGVYKFRDFLSIGRYISWMIQDTAIVTIEGE